MQERSRREAPKGQDSGSWVESLRQKDCNVSQILERSFPLARVQIRAFIGGLDTEGENPSPRG